VIVLLHGFIEEGVIWSGAAKSLSKNYKVIVPDLEGFGNSPLKIELLSMEYYAGEVFDMLKKEGVKKCVLIGHSMGGYIALDFAEKFPQMLSGLGLVNSHCYEDTTAKKENRKKAIEFIRKHGSKPFVKELYYNLFHESFRGKNKKFIDSLIHKAIRYSP